MQFVSLYQTARRRVPEDSSLIYVIYVRWTRHVVWVPQGVVGVSSHN